ncbi:MAG: type II secretion system minor pseudopilin GspK [Gammaproteobacteria bacterium]|nr:type II secretion system minor pseudopilin GspK [Gammaproteobacteria bacterium]
MAVPTAGMNAAPVQRGVALITALLVVALATVAAVAMASRQQLDVRRTANLLQGDQAYVYAQAVEDWARVVLKRDENKQVDSLDEDWAQQLSPIAVPGGQVNGFILDLQGRFNLNNLLNSDGQLSEPDLNYFRTLLRNLELNDQLTAAVLDWIDVDTQTRYEDYGDGAEDDFYLSTDVPYRAANREFQSISELRLVRGFDAEVWNKLAPYVCALQGRVALNVNTAAAPLLQALSEDLTQRDAEQLVEERGETGFERLDAFANSPVFASRPLSQAQQGNLAINSSYFLVRSEIGVGSARARVFSVLQRASNGATTLTRTQGTW